MERSVKRGLDAAKGGSSGVIDLGIEAVAKGAEKARNINEESAFKAIESLLSEKDYHFEG